MAHILVPILDSDEAEWAVNQAIALNHQTPVHVHLLAVRHPLPKHIAQFFSATDLRHFHEESGLRALQPAISLLEQAKIPFEAHVVVGRPAQSIVKCAQQRGCAQIVLPQRKEGLFASLGLGSVESQVRQLMQAQSA